MVLFSDTRYLCNFRLFDVGVALCWLRYGGASMGGHAWSVTSEDAKCERGRKSKIRARQCIENHESYNFNYSTFCVMSTVRRTSGPPKSYSYVPTPPRKESGQFFLRRLRRRNIGATCDLQYKSQTRGHVSSNRCTGP